MTIAIFTVYPNNLAANFKLYQIKHIPPPHTHTHLQFSAHLYHIVLWGVVLVAVSEHHSDIRCELTPTHVLPSIHLFLQQRERERERETNNSSLVLSLGCLGQLLCKASILSKHWRPEHVQGSNNNACC